MNRNLFSLAIAMCACACSSAATARSADKPGVSSQNGRSSVPDRHVIVISIDGLPPAAYMRPEPLGLRVPTLRDMRAHGAYSDGVIPVFPSLTYPIHTSMVTGVQPRTHGIHTNYAWDPHKRNDYGWNWYAESIRAPTIWQVTANSALSTALIHWPVTVGADAEFLVPDFWRTSTRRDLALTRSVSTKGLLDRVEQRFPGFYDAYKPWKPSDRSVVEIAIDVFEQATPALMLLHTLEVDSAQHQYGPWSQQAKEKIEEADRQLARLIQAIKSTGRWSQTILVVVSDHGFAPVSRGIRLAHLFATLDLTPNVSETQPPSWKATFVANGGQAYVYVADEHDVETKERLRQALNEISNRPDGGIARVYERDDIQALQGDPTAFLALAAADGYWFSSRGGDTLHFDSKTKGHHGYPPDRPAMRASMLVYGPSVAPGAIQGARAIDLAPTIADWLGVSMPTAEGRVLPVRISR